MLRVFAVYALRFNTRSSRSGSDVVSSETSNTSSNFTKRLRSLKTIHTH